jgi:hypothetical protein
MFHYILFFGFITLTVIIADPGVPAIADNNYVPPPSSYNYHGYRSQQQLQTPSPYLNKRNPSSNSPTDGNVPTRSSANQCKLHINCPSNKIKKEKTYFVI